MADESADIRRSALAGLDLGSRAGGAGGVLLAEGAAREGFVLRGPAGDAAFGQAVEAALGAALPLEPGEAAGIGADALLIRLGPDEWRLIAPLSDNGRLAARLASALGSGPGALVNVSSAATVVAVAGERAADLLATGAGIDLDPAAFPPGRAVRTRIGNAQALVHRKAEDAFDLYIPRSYARSFWEWLEERGREFEAAVAL